MTIYLESSEDVNTVFTNWHNSNLEIINDLLNGAKTSTEYKAYQNVLNIITELPIDTTLSINQFVMHRTIQLVEEGFHDDGNLQTS